MTGKDAAARFPIAYAMRKDYWDTEPKDRKKMTKAEQDAYLKEYQAKVISPQEQAMLKRGVSNAGFHYLGCAKTMALIGKAFAEALVK